MLKVDALIIFSLSVLWRSVKYECIYLKEFEYVAEVKEALIDYFDYYNNDRPHQSLGYKTPSDVYFGRVKIDNVFDNFDIYLLTKCCPKKIHHYK